MAMNVALAHGLIGSWDGSSRYIVDVALLFSEHGHTVTVFCEECTRTLPTGLSVRRLHAMEPGERFDLAYGSDLTVLPTLVEQSARFFYAPLDVLATAPDLERWALQRCDRVLRFTQPAIEVLERTYELPLQHKSLIAVYVSQEYEALPPPSFDRPRPAQLLWVGRLIPSKNVGFLMRSVALLKSTDWQLIIAGDGPERQLLERQCEQLGLTERVEFCGHEADLSPRFETASLFLTASRQEHYSLTVMEACSRGVPCLGLGRDDEGAIFNACNEQILDGRTGYIIHSEQELAQRVDELLRDEPRRHAMAQRGWERKQDEFTNERFWQALQGAL